jgi:APA family basic amino acid/polyamine antiporter
MGIFGTPPEVAIKAEVPLIFFLAWMMGAIVSFIGALTFAEIGSRYPAAGGFYKIFSHCYHPAFAFMVNWITVISNAASTAAVALMGAEYIAPILLGNMDHAIAVKIITISSIAALFVVNLRGIKTSSKVLNVLMVIKLSLLLILISAVFFVRGEHAENELAQNAMTGMEMFQAFLLCFVPVFFTYGGYQQTMNFGGDIKNANKNLPRAVFFGMTIVLIIYLLVNYSYYQVLGFEALQGTKTVAADITGLMFGNIAADMVSVLMFFSVLAYVNVSIMSNPRVYFAMAEDKVMPAILARVNKKTQVQEWALSLFCVFIFLTLFFMDSFKSILPYVMFFDSISLITAASAIFILRHRAKKIAGRQVGEEESIDVFKMKGYPFLPAIYILIYGAVNVSVLIANPEAATYGAILFISGLPLFFALRFIIKKAALNKFSE